MADQKKLTVEVYSDQLGAEGKRQLLKRYVTVNYANLDDALAKSRARVESEGRRVQAANFRAGKDGKTTDVIVIYVKGQ
jgi:hypothetical protein